jgi:DNA (cytosine-5)-methyltransferase 1
MAFSSLEICAGGGGQALGLEMAGFEHEGLVEIEEHACNTLMLNRPHWRVIQGDLKKFSGKRYEGIDLLAGGVPCPPFSIAGGQLGKDDERDLFPHALRLVKQISPKAIMLENVRGLFDPKFENYRVQILRELSVLNYNAEWKLVHSSSFGVPQLRPRSILIAFRKDLRNVFQWPAGNIPAKTVGETLFDLMNEKGWQQSKQWKEKANKIAPTLVGGSKKHGGPDLGPTRAKKAWADLGVDGTGIADNAPDQDFTGLPKLTNRMAARIQGFPDSWLFSGKKTAAYRQIGNAFPPPVAFEMGTAIKNSLLSSDYGEPIIFSGGTEEISSVAT